MFESLEKVKLKIEKFKEVKVEQVDSKENKGTDALCKLASSKVISGQIVQKDRPSSYLDEI